jgi:hypothetical protein
MEDSKEVIEGTIAMLIRYHKDLKRGELCRDSLLLAHGTVTDALFVYRDYHKIRYDALRRQRKNTDANEMQDINVEMEGIEKAMDEITDLICYYDDGGPNYAKT